jgi:AmmeMemoRadiSam system protein B
MQTPAVRRPAVAGRFYPGKPEDLTQQLDQFLAAGSSAPGKMETAMGCMVPHAGYIYSGQVAGSVFQRLPARATYIILCPNHTGRGAPLAIMSRGGWQTPLGTVPIDAALAASLQHSCRLLMEDSKAHESEHAIEVELPFLQRSVGEFSFVPIAIGVSRYAALEALGHGMAQSLKGSAGPVMIVASSDMNHYEPDDVTRIKDRKAIDQILALDPAKLYEVVREEDITMCGYGPAVAMMTAVKELGATRAELVRYATSADTSGDYSAVVGYAGMVIS